MENLVEFLYCFHSEHSGNFRDSDDNELLGMDTSCVFSDYKENDENIV